MIRNLEYNGISMTLLDFSNRKFEEVPALIESAKEMISKSAPGSALVVTDVTNLRFNSDMINMFKDLTAHNTPYVKASAVVGITGIMHIAYTAVAKFSKRNLELFDTREKAMDWLATQ